MKKEALEFYRERLCEKERSIQEKIRGLWHNSLGLNPAMEKRAEEQLKEAVKLLSNRQNKELRKMKKSLPYQYLLTYVLSLRRCGFYCQIGSVCFEWDKIFEMLDFRKERGRYPSERTLAEAYKDVRFDLNNYRTFEIDGQNLSDAKGIKFLKSIIKNKDRKGVRIDNRAFRSLKETLKKHDAPKWVLERLKWKNGKAKTTFARGVLIFTKNIK